MKVHSKNNCYLAVRDNFLAVLFSSGCDRHGCLMCKWANIFFFVNFELCVWFDFSAKIADLFNGGLSKTFQTFPFTYVTVMFHFI